MPDETEIGTFAMWYQEKTSCAVYSTNPHMFPYLSTLKFSSYFLLMGLLLGLGFILFSFPFIHYLGSYFYYCSWCYAGWSTLTLVILVSMVDLNFGWGMAQRVKLVEVLHAVVVRAEEN